MKNEINNMTINSKKSGFLPIENSNTKIPYTIIKGEEGPTTLITAGIHSAEYVSIQCAMELANELKQIKGTIIILPIVNYDGFTSHFQSEVAQDLQNLNRVFPATQDTLSHNLAKTLEQKLFSNIDYYIDLHGGDYFESLTPYVYTINKAKENVKEKALAMAKATNLPYIVKSNVSSGGAYNYAGSLDIPSILIEVGCEGLWSSKEVIMYKEAVLNVLKHLTHLNNKPKIIDSTIIDDVDYIDAFIDACWYPNYKVGSIISKGDCIGVIKDCFLNEIEQIIAKKDYVLLYQTKTLNIIKGKPLLALGIL